MSRDPIVRTIEIMRSLVPSITEEQALMCERAARAEWGGQRVDYIAKTCAADKAERRALQGRTATATEQAVVSAYLSNKPIGVIVQEHGISRRTLYRMVKR